MSFRIYLSPPHMGSTERALLLDAFDSNWVAPLGPHVEALERELAAVAGVRRAVALSSGTAALHLALLLAGVGPGDRVVTSTLTFVASANAIRYVGAEPVFIDAEPSSWNLDPTLLAEELEESDRQARRPAAILSVDLYGQSADYAAIGPLADRFGIPVVEDAAEALGATFGGRPSGAHGLMGAFSFNGNKIITASGGGALVTDDEDLADRALHLATQARDPAPHYEHSMTGYNYRLSNLLAAVARGQLQLLDDRLARRRAVNQRYRTNLKDNHRVTFMPFTLGEPNAWLTCILIDPDGAPDGRERVRHALLDRSIEARPVWKPMHQQPLFKDADVRNRGVADRLFRDGLCLPSGSSLTDADVDEICAVIGEVLDR